MLNQFNQEERRRLIITGMAVFLLLVAWLVFSPVGIVKLYKIKNNLSEVRGHNQDLSGRNQDLQEEIDKLQNDQKYLEEIARKKLGMLKKNELIFKFKQKKKRHH